MRTKAGENLTHTHTQIHITDTHTHGQADRQTTPDSMVVLAFLKIFLKIRYEQKYTKKKRKSYLFSKCI